MGRKVFRRSWVVESAEVPLYFRHLKSHADAIPGCRASNLSIEVPRRPTGLTTSGTSVIPRRRLGNPPTF